MENQKGLKLRISRMFRSSFGSCKSRNISDVVERPVSVPENRQHYQLIELFSPKPRPFPSICRPKYPETAETELFPRRKVSDRNSLLAPAADADGRKCPPASPISPLNTFYESKKSESKPKEKRPRKKTNKTTQLMKRGSFDNYYNWFSSDDDVSEVEDDDKTTLFSSKSLSSDSSDSTRRNKARHRTTRWRAARKDFETGLMPLQGNSKDSFAVVKRSSDPYNDFRTSMVEMIVEKQIFGARDLENLLQTFLSLNSYHHHKVIVEVYTEIWEALFSYCC